MDISNGKVSFAIHPDDRPYIEFERVLNRGTRPRKEKKDDKGKITRAAHPGEFKEVWRKHLISHRAPFDPYTWVTQEWALRRMEVGCVPVGYGNLEKLPAEYPREWKDKIAKCMSVVTGQAQANQRASAAEAKLKDAENKQDAAAPISAAEGSEGSNSSGSQAAPRTARQAANAARS